MNIYETIKTMTLDEMAEHHARYTRAYIDGVLTVIKNKTGVEFETLPPMEREIKNAREWLQMED
jgi:hypothetical protein